MRSDLVDLQLFSLGRRAQHHAGSARLIWHWRPERTEQWLRRRSTFRFNARRRGVRTDRGRKPLDHART